MSDFCSECGGSCRALIDDDGPTVGFDGRLREHDWTEVSSCCHAPLWEGAGRPCANGCGRPADCDEPICEPCWVAANMADGPPVCDPQTCEADNAIRQ